MTVYVCQSLHKSRFYVLYSTELFLHLLCMWNSYWFINSWLSCSKLCYFSWHEVYFIHCAYSVFQTVFPLCYHLTMCSIHAVLQDMVLYLKTCSVLGLARFWTFYCFVFDNWVLLSSCVFYFNLYLSYFSTTWAGRGPRGR